MKTKSQALFEKLSYTKAPTEGYLDPFGNFIYSRKPGSDKLIDQMVFNHETGKLTPAVKAGMVKNETDYRDYRKSFEKLNLKPSPETDNFSKRVLDAHRKYFT